MEIRATITFSALCWRGQEKNTEVMYSVAHFLAAVCCLPCRSFQGDLPSGSRIYLLTLRCADFAPGRRWCAEHRSVLGGAGPCLPSDSILPPLISAAFWAQLPTDTPSTPVPRIFGDTTSTPTPSDATSASPSVSASQRKAWTGRWE